MSVNKQNLGRKKYSSQFKEQVLERAHRDGVSKTAKDLGLAASQVYAWRAKAPKGGDSLEHQKLQQAEHARLKREVSRLSQENAFLKKVAVYFTQERE